MQSTRWLNWAAIGTWFVVSLPTLYRIATGRVAGLPAAAFLVAFVLFGAMLVLCLSSERVPALRRTPALAIETVCGLVMVYISGDGTAGATLVIVAAQAPYFMALRQAAAWVVVQTVALTAIFAVIGGALAAISGGIALGGFQLFAIATSSLALRERAAREELTRANAELTAARELLAENTRAGERLRISRDLHDTLGHHLTALSLQLDVASRLTDARARDHVLEAHAITRLLLSDVRDVVGTLRETSRFDVARAVRELTSSTGNLQVHVDMPDTFELADPTQAHALVRAVQEIITNAMRHAAARNLWIRLEPRDDGVALQARDDGQGDAAVVWGNGLTGMRERFAELQGHIDVTSSSGRGFEVRGFLPRTEPTR
jgi:signal transduction histidine kinase